MVVNDVSRMYIAIGAEKPRNVLMQDGEGAVTSSFLKPRSPSSSGLGPFNCWSGDADLMQDGRLINSSR